MTNFDLKNIVETSDEWIKKRMGISERRVLDESNPSYIHGVIAAQRASDDAKYIMGQIINIDGGLVM